MACTGELEKNLETSQQWVLAYPRDSLSHAFLAFALDRLGRYERAAEEYRESLRLDPDNSVPYDNLIRTQFNLGRVDEAEATLREIERRKPDWLGLHPHRYELAFIRGDVAGMQREVAWSVNNPEMGEEFLYLEARTEASYGHLGRLRELMRRGIERERRAGQQEAATGLEIAESYWEAEFGNSERARRQTAAVLAESSATRELLFAALVLARTGDATRAQAVVEKLSKRFPRDTLINGYWLPSIRGAIELHRGNAAHTIELLDAAIPYELVDAEQGVPLYPAYLRGEAYLALGRGSEAAAEFQKLLDHRSMLIEPLVLAHLGRARAYAFQGDTGKARSAYQSLFTLWRDADPDIPIFQQAKAEYAKLK